MIISIVIFSYVMLGSLIVIAITSPKYRTVGGGGLVAVILTLVVTAIPLGGKATATRLGFWITEFSGLDLTAALQVAVFMPPLFAAIVTMALLWSMHRQ
jgi:hypothetical protein